MKKELERFVNAQHNSYNQALAEIKRGKKQSHWMWYIFPQIQGLGFSETAKFFAIEDLHEAAAYLQHQILGSRLLAISNELLKLPASNARQIFGSPDDVKLKSSMTLFSCLPNAGPVFQQVLDKFFNGAKDSRTLEILKR